MLRGTWATIELQKAVELGYQIRKIHEVWHFREEDRKVGLFADYFNTWLKIKQESARLARGISNHRGEAGIPQRVS